MAKAGERARPSRPPSPAGLTPGTWPIVVARPSFTALRSADSRSEMMAVPFGRNTAAHGMSSCRSRRFRICGAAAGTAPLPLSSPAPVGAPPLPAILPDGASFPLPVHPDRNNARHTATSPAGSPAARKARTDTAVWSEAGSPGSPESCGLRVGRRLEPDFCRGLLIVGVPFLVVDHRAGVALDHEISRAAAVRAGRG